MHPRYNFVCAHRQDDEVAVLKKVGVLFAGKRIVREPVPINKDEPLKLELSDFVACVRERQTPKVSGAQAKAALDVAFEIVRQIQASP